MPKALGRPSDLINSNPVPSGCNHRNTTHTVTSIDGGEVDTCDFCGTVCCVTEWG
jgi:hypothetical protein